MHPDIIFKLSMAFDQSKMLQSVSGLQFLQTYGDIHELMISFKMAQSENSSIIPVVFSLVYA
jgi:hypothetical protein